MMENATLLVVCGKSARPVDFEPISGASRERNLHLIILILGAMPRVPIYTYGYGEIGAYALPDGWQEEVAKENAELNVLRAEISQYLADQGASAEIRIVSGEAASLPDAVARSALTCDAIVICDDLRDDDHLFDSVVRVALFGTPAGVILNGTKSSSALRAKTVFVAWKAGLPAARAVHAAIPILRDASKVTIALFDPITTGPKDGENPGTDIAAWLTHQGCIVTVQQYPSGGDEVGHLILKRAMESGADLIVMGAYDHSRLREIVFGGTTHTLIAQRDFPVLLSH